MNYTSLSPHCIASSFDEREILPTAVYHQHPPGLEKNHDFSKSKKSDFLI